jgi:hypothetical protein
VPKRAPCWCSRPRHRAPVGARRLACSSMWCGAPCATMLRPRVCRSPLHPPHSDTGFDVWQAGSQRIRISRSPLRRRTALWLMRTRHVARSTAAAAWLTPIGCAHAPLPGSAVATPIHRKRTHTHVGEVCVTDSASAAAASFPPTTFARRKTFGSQLGRWQHVGANTPRGVSAAPVRLRAPVLRSARRNAHRVGVRAHDIERR